MLFNFKYKMFMLFFMVMVYTLITAKFMQQIYAQKLMQH